MDAKNESINRKEKKNNCTDGTETKMKTTCFTDFSI